MVLVIAPPPPMCSAGGGWTGYHTHPIALAALVWQDALCFIFSELLLLNLPVGLTAVVSFLCVPSSQSRRCVVFKTA